MWLLFHPVIADANVLDEGELDTVLLSSVHPEVQKVAAFLIHILIPLALMF